MSKKQCIYLSSFKKHWIAKKKCYQSSESSISHNLYADRGFKILQESSLPGASVVKNPPANAGNTGLIPSCAQYN